MPKIGLCILNDTKLWLQPHLLRQMFKRLNTTLDCYALVWCIDRRLIMAGGEGVYSISVDVWSTGSNIVFTSGRDKLVCLHNLKSGNLYYYRVRWVSWGCDIETGNRPLLIRILQKFYASLIKNRSTNLFKWRRITITANGWKQVYMIHTGTTSIITQWVGGIQHSFTRSCRTL